MTRNQIIEQVYTNQSIINYAKSICPDDYEELKSSLIMELYKMNLNKLKIAANNKFIEYLCFTIMKRIMWGSYPKTTIFNKKQTVDIAEVAEQTTEEFDFEAENENNNKYNQYRNIINQLHWYDKTLWDLYYTEGHKLREIEQMTGIKLKTIHANITKTKNHIKQQIKK